MRTTLYEAIAGGPSGDAPLRVLSAFYIASSLNEGPFWDPFYKGAVLPILV